MNEAETFPEKTFQHLGFEFTVRGGSGLYNYKFDEKWNQLNHSLKSREEQMKTSFKLAQKGQGLLVDQDSGEQIPSAEYTPTKGSVSVKKVE